MENIFAHLLLTLPADMYIAAIASLAYGIKMVITYKPGRT